MSLFSKTIENIFPAPILYVKISHNSFEVTWVGQNKCIKRKSSVSFSNQRLLLAEFYPAEKFLKELIDELLDTQGKIIKRSTNMIIQNSDKKITELTSVERRAYEDLLIQCGAKYYWVVEHQKTLYEQELIEITKDKSAFS